MSSLIPTKIIYNDMSPHYGDEIDGKDEETDVIRHSHQEPEKVMELITEMNVLALIQLRAKLISDVNYFEKKRLNARKVDCAKMTIELETDMGLLILVNRALGEHDPKFNELKLTIDQQGLSKALEIVKEVLDD